MSASTAVPCVHFVYAVLLHNSDWSGPSELKAWIVLPRPSEEPPPPDLHVRLEAARPTSSHPGRGLRLLDYRKSDEVDVFMLHDLLLAAGHAIGMRQLGAKVVAAVESLA